MPIKAMMDSRIHVQLGIDAGVHEALRILDILIDEQIKFAGEDGCRRYTSEVRHSRRRCIRRHFLCPVIVSQICAPGMFVVVAVPELGIGHGLAGWRDVPVIEHRINQQLMGN